MEYVLASYWKNTDKCIGYLGVDEIGKNIYGHLGICLGLDFKQKGYGTQKYLTKRKCMVIISGNPKKVHTKDPNTITRQYFALSGIPFDEYIYVNDPNKDNIKKLYRKSRLY